MHVKQPIIIDVLVHRATYAAIIGGHEYPQPDQRSLTMDDDLPSTVTCSLTALRRALSVCAFMPNARPGLIISRYFGWAHRRYRRLSVSRSL